EQGGKGAEERRGEGAGERGSGGAEGQGSEGARERGSGGAGDGFNDLSAQLPGVRMFSPPHYLRQIWAIVRKDIAAELHTREIVNAMFVFAVLALLIFSFAFDLRGAMARAAVPGVLWVTIVFAGTLGLSRALAREQQTGGMEGLLLAPVDRGAIFFGKALGNLLLMLAMEAVLLPLGSVMFNTTLISGDVVRVILLGTLGYAAVGTLLAAIAVNTRAREVMLPILLLPLTVPLLIAAVQATGGLLEGLTWSEVGGWTRLLIVYDLLIVAVSMLTFGYVVEE
ncbi:MAG: heme exporter protein CcmB, partial [Anaerolineae bacterium]|nr:heme exporter protein CcmB [Anaerolineae bacterium]